MKRFAYITVSALFLFFIAVPQVSAQEEATEEEATEAQEEVVEEAVVEEAVEEEVSPLAGFTAGINVGWPVVTGQYLKGATSTGPNIGVIVGTPFGLPLGPLNVGVGAEILTYSWGDYYSGVAVLGTINASLNDLIPMELPGVLSIQIGGGYFGAGLGTTFGGSFDYPVPNIPLVVKAYARGNATTTASGDFKEPTGWLNVGVMLSYDISTLF